MRLVWRATKLAFHATVWALLGVIAGLTTGYDKGYVRGVRDLGRLVIELRTDPEEPTRWSKGDI